MIPPLPHLLLSDVLTDDDRPGAFPTLDRAFDAVERTLARLGIHRGYRELDHEIRYWRTKTGLEIDCIPGERENGETVRREGSGVVSPDRAPDARIGGLWGLPE